MVGPKRDAVRNLYQRVTTTRSLPTKVKYPYQGTTPTNRYSTRSERVWPPPLDGVGVRAALGQLSFLYASSRSTDSVLIPSGSGYLVSPCPGPASLPISPLIHCLLASPSPIDLPSPSTATSPTYYLRIIGHTFAFRTAWIVILIPLSSRLRFKSVRGRDSYGSPLIIMTSTLSLWLVHTEHRYLGPAVDLLPPIYSYACLSLLV
jgi:hypothetical protein